jgi:hypothetical protein
MFPLYLVDDETFYRTVHRMADISCQLGNSNRLSAYEKVNGIVIHVVQEGYEDKFLGGHLRGKFKDEIIRRISEQAVKLCDGLEMAASVFRLKDKPFQAEEEYDCAENEGSDSG